MAYKPSLQDIDESNGYQPSVDDISESNDNSDMVPTFIGKMPLGPIKAPFGSKESFVNPETVGNLMDFAAGQPGIKAVGGAAMKTVQKLPQLKDFINTFKTRSLIEPIQKGADKLLKQSSDIYDLVKERVLPEGVSKINLDSKLLEEAANHLPKTQASKALVEAARSGDYNALHELQSDLGKLGSDAKGGETYADRNKGEEILDTRSKINDAIRNTFKENDKGYLAKLLDEASDKYRKMHEIYYKHPTIAKLVNPKTRIVPKNPMTALTEESERTKKLLEAHPELNRSIKNMKKLNTVKKIAGYTTLEELVRRNLIK